MNDELLKERALFAAEKKAEQVREAKMLARFREILIPNEGNRQWIAKWTRRIGVGVRLRKLHVD